jgi:hypothetical protein
VKCLPVAGVAAALLLSLGLFVSAAAQKFSPDSATVIFATAARASTPLLEVAIDESDKNLPAPGPSYLKPTTFRPPLFIPAAKRSDSQTTDAAKKDLKLYQLTSVLLI